MICFLVSAALIVSGCLSLENNGNQIGKAVIWTLDDAGMQQSPEYLTQSFDVKKLSRHLIETVQSKELFVYLRKEDSTSLLSIPYIASSIKSSSEAVVIPHLYAAEGKEGSKRFLIDELATNGVVTNTIQLTLSQLHEKVVSKSSPLKNGVLDTYVVTLTGDSSEENEFKAISRSARSSSVVMMVADDPSALAPQAHAEYTTRMLSSPFSYSSNGTWEGGEFSIYYQGKYLYLTPDIFTGLMTMLFFLVISLIGYNCLGSIQGPSTFANKLPALGKEA
mmetsp:Transcript_15670/g.15798  ORF Transcript_15670/g.15798 Transcript_15670/m.15798 type:complete len:278 (-) Transcript_15670:197-1030(-)|eukprot:CAMPEP_0182427580 /NCGR_PEP_ID=MMETSP1167-20130531/18648_1 /TAXON_ID=2988 /ORGANISM="Mallomonas Sp, Strain CCMP3275" /LENGTH=277 /DNA_ID=CAMNT_0024609911 /DNA_START=63 /DNA_END=896 /DNA_ORIENTATION=+